MTKQGIKVLKAKLHYCKCKNKILKDENISTKNIIEAILNQSDELLKLKQQPTCNKNYLANVHEGMTQESTKHGGLQKPSQNISNKSFINDTINILIPHKRFRNLFIKKWNYSNIEKNNNDFNDLLDEKLSKDDVVRRKQERIQEEFWKTLVVVNRNTQNQIILECRRTFLNSGWHSALPT